MLQRIVESFTLLRDEESQTSLINPKIPNNQFREAKHAKWLLLSTKKLGPLDSKTAVEA